jgi:cytidyltransferase-like protein
MVEKKIIYIDGVFDLFHRGHLESLKKAKNFLNDPDNTYLIVGVVSDVDCESYKRKPIISENDRVEIIKSINLVDQVIFPCPLYSSLEFIKNYNIDIIVHGFSNEKDRQNQDKFFFEIKDYFKEIEYYDKISTTDIINKIKNLN